jgi:multiple sugar transport system permease protein/raffinose/stachyose/melibiose transport system permease protein
MTRRRVAGAARVGLLVVLALLVMYPFFMMIEISLKDLGEFARQFWLPELPLHFEYYPQVAGIILPYLKNSIIITGLSTAGVLLVATFAAYSFARFSFPGRTVLYYLMIALMMIPAILTLVPMFLLVKNLGLVNTPRGLILPYIAGGEVFAIFVLRSFFAALPNELFEAARMDGATDWSIFWRIAVPLTKPVLGTVAIVQVLSTWNDYVWPLIVLSDDSVKTLVLGLATSFVGKFQTQWGPLMSGYTLASVPLILLFAFTMRYFIEGLTSGALKL